jgi:hypothetical protein
MNHATAIHDLFVGCLFREGEPTDGAVMVDGITAKFGFHPERVAEAREPLRRAADAIVTDGFRKTGGGGMSFLSLCETRDGEQWGEHVNCQELCCLAIATGLASWCMPRELWGILPGGMPYVVFDL